MSGVNKVILVGNLGQDPESRSFPDGGSVCNVSIATSESWTDKQTGQKQERTEWHKVAFKNKLAEVAQQYLGKGSKVYIEGKLQTRKWTNKEGAEQYTTEIQAMQMQMLDSKGADSSAPQAPAPAPMPSQAPAPMPGPTNEQLLIQYQQCATPQASQALWATLNPAQQKFIADAWA